MSRSPDVKYQPLSQLEASDDEDEGFGDNILFDSRLVNGPTTDKRNIFEMEELGLPRVRSQNYGHFTKRRRWCAAIMVIFLLVVATGCGVIIPFLETSRKNGQVLPVEYVKASQDWNRTFYDTWTESSVFLMDIDNDQFDDILIGLAHQKTMERVLNKPKNISMRQYCKSIGLEYPCGATVSAFRGLDGTLLYETGTRSMVIHQMCVDLEIAGDRKHCIITGRHATCQLIEASTGRIHWVVDLDYPRWASHFVPTWNVYQAAVVLDVDGDTVLDVLVSHGGDKDKQPWDHDRKAGRLILLSGMTGFPIGDHFLELPDNKETYMPPIKYITSSGAIYILIGTGGETISGSLLAISLPDIYRHVTGAELPNKDPNVRYDWLESKDKDKSGFVVIFRGTTKGVMVPPVLVDADKDGSVDILVTTFDGQVALINGKNLELNWVRTFDGMESYSSPTPGFFNDDSVLDWLVHLNEGAWDRYNSSDNLILNGVDGSTLWSLQAQSYAYSSDLSLELEDVDLKDKLSHMFIMKVVGINSSFESVQENIGLRKRHLGHQMDNVTPQSISEMNTEEFQNMCDSVSAEVNQRHATCGQDLESLTQDVVMFDYKLRNDPLHILKQKAERFHYQLDHKPGTLHCHSVSERHKDKINMCTVLTPTSYTGAVGDLDGDNHLDYVHVTQMLGTRYSDTYNPLGSISKVILSKHNFHSVMVRKDFLNLDSDNNNMVTYDEDSGLPLTIAVNQHVDSIRFRPLQGWCQYLGSRGDSWYHVPSPPS